MPADPDHAPRPGAPGAAPGSAGIRSAGTQDTGTRSTGAPGTGTEGGGSEGPGRGEAQGPACPPTAAPGAPQAGGVPIAALAAVAHRLADAAAVETLRGFRQPALDVADKGAAGAFDPVTAADRAAERAMRAVLASERPQDGVLGEEFGPSRGASGLTWVLDPIDGTRGYLAGTPTWGTLIAVGDASGPRFGIVDQPYTGERFEGGAGLGAALRRDGGVTPLAVRAVASLGGAILMTTFPEIGSAGERAAFERVAARVRLVRYGMDCYAYALLAAGHVDLVIEAGLKPYDIAAPLALVEGAGGIVTDWRGGPAREGGQVIAAGDAGLHRAALALLAEG